MRQYRTLSAAKQDTKPVEAEMVFLAGVDGALCGGWVDAAAYFDPVQRVDGSEPERIYDAAQDSLAVREWVCEG